MDADLGWLSGDPRPLAGETSVSTQPWEEAALLHRGAFELGLRAAGMPEPALNEALDLRDEVSTQAALLDSQIADYRFRNRNLQYIDTPLELQKVIGRRGSVVGRLRDWFRGSSFRVEDTEEVAFRIPLFVLAAADVARCTASITTLQERAGALSWGITVFGTGLAGSAKLSTATSSKFTAARGEIKVVFLPVAVLVEKGTMLENGRPIGDGHRVDPTKLRTTGAPGPQLLQTGTIPPIGALAERYPLSGDTSGALATYEYTYAASAGGDLSIGVKAFGVDLSLKTTVELSRAVTVTYELASGLDYELHRVKDGEGLVWGPPTSQ